MKNCWRLDGLLYISDWFGVDVIFSYAVIHLLIGVAIDYLFDLLNFGFDCAFLCNILSFRIAFSFKADILIIICLSVIYTYIIPIRSTKLLEVGLAFVHL